MSFSTYKLIYYMYNARGRAEISRFIFTQAGVKYEDSRVTREEWAQLKPNTPTGMLPLLEVDGKQLAGSGVMGRFLAERFGLAGSNDVENAEIAGIVDVVHDFGSKFEILFAEKDEEKKAKLQKAFVEEDVPKYWGILEKISKKNDSTEGWVYGNTLTYADFVIYCMLDYVLLIAPNFNEQFPCMAKLRGAVGALPDIAQWIKNRPQTEI